MKAITLLQPWASMIALGHKTIETRTHAQFRHLVGERIAIHAGLRYAPYAFDMLVDAGFNPLDSLLTALPEVFPRGVVVCTAFAKDFRLLDQEDSKAALCATAGLFGLILADVVALEPIPAKGRQGVWNWETSA